MNDRPQDQIGFDELSVSDRIDVVCDAFDRQWIAKKCPRIEDYLDGFEHAEYSKLLSELIAVELGHRQQLAESPTVDEYCVRFPDHTKSLHEIFKNELNTDEQQADLQTAVPAGQRASSAAESAAASFEQINSLCQTFTRDWTPSDEPSIGRFLQDVSEDAQETLLRNLLAIEIERRREAGQRPKADEYLAEFPKFAGLIRQVFLESSSVSTIAGGDTGPKLVNVAVPAASRLGDYQLIRELGRGGMGAVYEAVHVQRGNHVALKTLPLVDGATLHRFKREFRSLADINHPNLIGLNTLESDGSHWFFTMDLIEGVDFRSYVRPSDELDESKLRSALAQLVTGVLALHGNHIIHRDLKPSNVMVTDDGRVLLLDFGLVLELAEAGVTESSAKVMGTVTYMAPEQAAAQTVTAASDWYSVGVMLYEALSGHPPFKGEFLSVLQAKQQRDAPALAGELPTDLVDLCMQLLSRDPQQRPDPLAIAKVVAHQTQITSPVVSFETRLVGRDQQLAVLSDALHTLQTGQEPAAVFISGRSGEGKTSLSEHFLEPLRSNKELAVMSGRCYDRESVPFKALDNLIDALCSFLRSLPDDEAALLMPLDVGVLAQVFPVLQRVKVVAKATGKRLTAVDEQQTRTRAFGALRELFARMSNRWSIVLFIDDLQWGDSDSAEALFEVLRPPEAPAILLLATYRSDEAEGSPFLTAWQELQRKHGATIERRDVKVGPLTLEECTELVIDLLRKDTDVIRRRAEEFFNDTAGNPFLLIELVGCFDPETDSFQAMPIHEVINQKLQRLPEDAERLLEVVAVSGQALPLDEASRTAGHKLPPMSTLTHMRNERLVRLIGPDDSVLLDTYHDRIRETVLAEMDDDSQKSTHLTLAQVIEADVGSVSQALIESLEKETRQQSDQAAIPRVFDLAYHFDAAGDRGKAWTYALLAAEQARNQSALEVAVEQFGISQRNCDESNDTVRFRIAEGCGEALMLLGRYDDATVQLEGAIDRTNQPIEKARIEALQGEISFRSGAIDDSILYFESGLRRIGNWVPRTLFGQGYGILSESLIQCLHSMFPKRLHRKLPSNELDLTIHLCNWLLMPTIFQSTLKLMWCHLSGLNRAELVPPSAGLALSSSMHGTVMSMLGWHRRGPYYSDRGRAVAAELEDVLLVARSYSYSGIGHTASAHFEQGLATLGESIKLFEKAGDLWELNMAHFHKGCCHFGLGQFGEAIAEARWTFDSSTRIGDTRTMCSSYLWARATRGDIPFEELSGCFPCRPDDVMSTVHGLMAEGHWHSFHGRTLEALQTIERAGEMVRQSHCINAHTIVVLPVLVATLRRHADAVQPKDPQQSEKLRKRALRLAKWAVRLTCLFPAAYPESLRELSLLFAVKGKPRKALKIADKSCAVADSQKAKYEYAQSLLVRGKLAHELGLPKAEEQIQKAESALQTITSQIEQEPSKQQIQLAIRGLSSIELRRAGAEHPG